MTTAARPTFDPARANDSKAPTFQYSARDLASHTKLKFRQPGQGTTSEIGDRQQLLEELRRAEEQYYQEKEGGASNTRLIKQNDEEKQKLIAEAERLAKLDKDDTDQESDSDGSSSSDDDDDDDDDDDNEAELLATLQRIRKERAEEKERQEREAKEEEEEEKQKEAMVGNPLLNLDVKRDFSVKRRWDDDVIFKNQARGIDDKPKKRFVNDMLRSDFHRKFLHKYIQ